MRRAVLTLGGTVAGLVALFSYKTHVPGTAPVAGPGSPAALSATAPRQSAPASTKPTPAPTKAKATASPSPTPKPATRSFEGSNVSTQYGPVQVAITVTGGKIANAGDTQQPEDSIGANAVQQLNREVLTAQSANVQAVSGATYTSDGYIQSLQQAVDQAGL